jgi:hypothetical protein
MLKEIKIISFILKLLLTWMFNWIWDTDGNEFANCAYNDYLKLGEKMPSKKDIIISGLK